MAIIENKATETGDVILIQVNVPIIGLISLTDFLDDTDGEGVGKTFNKSFRYSNNGITYSPWLDLTLINIQNIQVQTSDTFFIEYRYERIGDPGGDLAYNSSTLSGNFEQPVCGKAYAKSLFGENFSCTDTEVLLWAINVTEKLYEKGIVPNYITRNNEDDEIGDEDYINFWRSVALFFSFFVKLIRTIGNSLNDPKIALEYIKQRNMFSCSEREQVEIIYVLQNYYDEIRKRGTLMPFEKKGVQQYDGEFLRLICNQPQDEYLFSPIEPHKIGWFLDSSSPAYKGLSETYNTNKSYESTKDFQDLSLYPHSGGMLITEAEKTVYEFGESEGIFYTGDNSKIINVSPNLDYEMTFFIKTGSSTSQLDIGVAGFNSNGNLIPLVNPVTGNPSSYFTQNQFFKVLGKYIFVRAIIWNSTKVIGNAEDNLLNINSGQNLRLTQQHTGIIPIVQSRLNEFKIWDLKIRPLKTDFNTSFIQTSDWANCWYKNNNKDYSPEQITDISRRYLTPYKTQFLGIELS
jgi:hypothetical protein